jgi:hypothetical protein
VIWKAKESRDQSCSLDAEMTRFKECYEKASSEVSESYSHYGKFTNESGNSVISTSCTVVHIYVVSQIITSHKMLEHFYALQHVG